MEVKEVYDLAHKLFAYETGTGNLIWKIDKPPSQAGRIAGRKNLGYIFLSMETKTYSAHRIIFLMHNGRWPKDQIDHVNGIRDDNRLGNLREVDQSENSRNASVRSDSSSGVLGVNWQEKRRKWRSRISFNGKVIYLGDFVDLDDAISARKEAEIKYGYHSNHGRERRYDKPIFCQ